MTRAPGRASMRVVRQMGVWAKNGWADDGCADKDVLRLGVSSGAVGRAHDLWQTVTEMDETGNILSAPDARSLVLDLFTAQGGARFTSSELTRAGAVFGHSPTAMRTAIARLRQQGRITALSRGLYGEGGTEDPWRRRIDDWRARASRRTAWTGGWLMAAARPSRVSRTAWRATLRALDVEGFRQTPQGLWLRPDTLEDGAEGCHARLLAYGATAELLTGRLEALDPDWTTRTRALWDVEGLAARRRLLLDRLEDSGRRMAGLAPMEAARETLIVGRAAVRAIVRDPLLPQQWDAAPGLQALIDAMVPYVAASRVVWLAYLRR